MNVNAQTHGGSKAPTPVHNAHLHQHTSTHTHTAHRHGLTAAKSEALTQIRKPEHMISLVKRAIGGHQQHFKGGGVERWEKRLVRGGEDR